MIFPSMMNEQKLRRLEEQDDARRVIAGIRRRTSCERIDFLRIGAFVVDGGFQPDGKQAEHVVFAMVVRHPHGGTQDREALRVGAP